MNTPDQARELRLALSLARHSTTQSLPRIRNPRKDEARTCLESSRQVSMTAAACRIDERNGYGAVQGS